MKRNPVNLIGQTMLISILVIIVALSACTSTKSNYISIDVKDVDYQDKSSLLIEGTPIDLGIIGVRNITVYDSLLMLETMDPDGMVKVFSTNTLKQLGNLCTRGRAGNEFGYAFTLCGQIYRSGTDILFPLTNNPSGELKTVNISESLRSGVTTIANTSSIFLSGEYIMLDNDPGNRFEYHVQELMEMGGTTMPVSYSINKGGQSQELQVFPELMKSQDDFDVLPPYDGTLAKHPAKNIVIQVMKHMDYILFFDFENNKQFAIHQDGTLTYDDVYPQDGNGNTFADIAVADDYFFVLYWNGKYSNSQDKSDRKPELLMFDWKGRFLKSAKLGANVSHIEFDSTHKQLFGLNRQTESLYLFDLTTLLNQ